MHLTHTSEEMELWRQIYYYVRRMHLTHTSEEMALPASKG